MEEKLKVAFSLIVGIQDRMQELGLVPAAEWRGRNAHDLYVGLKLLENRCRNECSDIIDAMLNENASAPCEHHRYLIWMRCACALDTMDILKAKLDEKTTIINISHDATSDEVMRWMMIDNWNHRHDVWLKLTAFSILTGNPFYSGLEF